MKSAPRHRFSRVLHVGRTVSFRGMAYTIAYLTFVEFVIVYGVVSWFELDKFISGANLVRDTALSIHDRSHRAGSTTADTLQFSILPEQLPASPDDFVEGGEVEMLLDVLVKGLFGQRADLLMLGLVPKESLPGLFCPRINFMLVGPEEQDRLSTDHVLDLQHELFPALRLAGLSVLSPGSNILIKSELPESAASDCEYRVDLTIRMDDRLGALTIGYLSQAWLVAAFLLLVNAVLVFLGIRNTIVRPLENIVRRIENIGENPRPRSSDVEESPGLYELTRISEAVDELHARTVTRNMLQRAKKRQLHEITGLGTTALAYLDGSSAESKKHVARCFQEAVRQVAMIIDFAGFDASSLHRQEIGVHQLVELIEEAMDDAAAYAQLREGEDSSDVCWLKGHPDLSTLADNDWSPVLNVDKSSIAVILRNFFKNSVESFRGKGNVLNRILVGLVVDRTSGAVQVIVEDNGIGIESEMRQRLFVEGETSKSDGNQGIGLSLADRLARAQGGEITISSRHVEDGCPLQDTGTSVRLVLPTLDSEATLAGST